jgi:hypothetical protein
MWKSEVGNRNLKIDPREIIGRNWPQNQGGRIKSCWGALEEIANNTKLISRDE